MNTDIDYSYKAITLRFINFYIDFTRELAINELLNGDYSQCYYHMRGGFRYKLFNSSSDCLNKMEIAKMQLSDLELSKEDEEILCMILKKDKDVLIKLDEKRKEYESESD